MHEETAGIRSAGVRGSGNPDTAHSLRARPYEPARSEPAWPSLQGRALAVRACYDCHSNETEWPWYSNIAPVSWLIYHDVTEGRRHINFSDWTRPEPQHADEFQDVYRENSMPPGSYLLLHPAARLNIAERKQLFDALGIVAASYRH